MKPINLIQFLSFMAFCLADNIQFERTATLTGPNSLINLAAFSLCTISVWIYFVPLTIADWNSISKQIVNGL